MTDLENLLAHGVKIGAMQDCNAEIIHPDPANAVSLADD